jgi:hypothetical protein
VQVPEIRGTIGHYRPPLVAISGLWMPQFSAHGPQIRDLADTLQARSRLTGDVARQIIEGRESRHSTEMLTETPAAHESTAPAGRVLSKRPTAIRKQPGTKHAPSPRSSLWHAREGVTARTVAWVSRAYPRGGPASTLSRLSL